jgi:hypothetical protein
MKSTLFESFTLKTRFYWTLETFEFLKSSKKLDHEYYELFEIEELIEKQINKLWLSHTFR